MEVKNALSYVQTIYCVECPYCGTTKSDEDGFEPTEYCDKCERKFTVDQLESTDEE